MLKIFITKRLDKVTDSILLQLMTSNEEFIGGLFQKIKTDKFKNLVEFVQSPEKADYFLMPHNYFSVWKNKNYLNHNENFAKKYNKKIIIFAYGDRNSEVKIKNSIVLRTSQYKSQLRKNEIIIPPFVEDLGIVNGIVIKDFDKNRKPSIGFAGWVSCSNVVQWIKYKAKIFIQFLLLQVKKIHSPVVYQGLHFRRKVITILNHSDLLETKFFLRHSYSGHKKTIQDNPEKIRREFIFAIKDSDLALAVKGDGNYSLRFFEILSLGRIPLFIDTDISLPLEDEIDYDAFVLRVDYEKIHDLPKIINRFWQRNTDQSFKEMQTNARQAFKYRLSTEAFYTYLFNNFDDIVNNHERDIR